MNHARSYLAAALLAACGLAVLLYWGLSTAGLKVFSVSEFLEKAAFQEPVQIYGRVKQVEHIPPYRLLLADRDDPEKILSCRPAGEGQFQGAQPGPGQDVLASGRFHVQSGMFEVNELITSCPARYEAMRPAHGQAEPVQKTQPPAGFMPAGPAPSSGTNNSDQTAEGSRDFPQKTTSLSPTGPGAP